MKLSERVFSYPLHSVDESQLSNIGDALLSEDIFFYLLGGARMLYIDMETDSENGYLYPVINFAVDEEEYKPIFTHYDGNGNVLSPDTIISIDYSIELLELALVHINVFEEGLQTGPQIDPYSLEMDGLIGFLRLFLVYLADKNYENNEVTVHSFVRFLEEVREKMEKGE